MTAYLRAAFVVALMALTALPGIARADEAPFSEARKTEIGAIVKAYLMDHPEVIQDAMAALEQRQKDAEAEQQKKATAQLASDLSDAGKGVVLGNPSGDVTLIEFFDYNCGYCKKSLPDLMGMLKDDPKLRLILRDFPVLGPDSVEASQVALAVRKQFPGARYMDFHQKLIESKGRVGKDRALQVARDLGADMEQLNRDLATGETRTLLESTMNAADQLRIGGTPAFVVGDGVITGAVGRVALESSVSSVRTCGHTSC